MKVRKQKTNYKQLSAIPVAVLLILSFIKIVSPGFYQKFSSVGSEFNSKPTRGFKPEPTTNLSLCAGRQACVARVTKVVDGDTIDLATGERVRYIGVDTPETKHPIKKVECFGKEATEKNKELVLEKEVRLEKDVSDKDRYGRLLRYVYVQDLFVNDYLARNGFAHAATFPPDVKFSELFLAAEREARENSRGLWAAGACP